MNVGKTRASVIKHVMQTESSFNGGNPYHGRHISQFCDYADATAAGAAEEVKKEIPGVVQQEVSKQLSKQKVQVEVDKQSVKVAQKAINDLFAPLAKWFK